MTVNLTVTRPERHPKLLCYDIMVQAASIPLIPLNSLHLVGHPLNTQANLQDTHHALLDGEILLETRSHTAWGGAVTAQMYLSRPRAEVWQDITNYPQWVQYFPDITCSEIIGSAGEAQRGGKRLYQAARKAFMMITAEVEVYLRVFEIVNKDAWQSIQFCMERGSFNDFFADLKLQDYGTGTLLTYAVQATPTIPVPSMLIQQAMRLDLPQNMRSLRQAICG